MTLCLLSDIDVNFRFDSILVSRRIGQHLETSANHSNEQEVPLNILVDGNIIGFDIPALYFKRKV